MTEIAIAEKQQIQTQEPESSALISMIERAARDPQVDIDKMERLFQMHERIEQRRSISAFNAAMAAAQAELKPVVRNLENKQTNSQYADLAAISESADPIIHKHGLATICSEFKSAEPNCIGIRCEVAHAHGYSKTYDFNIPLDGTGLKGNPNKTATHAYASTVTYGRRYAKLSVFDIATKGADTDGNQPDGVITPDQAEELAKLITESKADYQKVLEFHRIESLSDMPAKDFQKSKAMLLARKAKLMKDTQHAS